MNTKHILVTIIISVIVGISVYLYKPKEAELKLQFPPTVSVNPQAGLSCEAFITTYTYGSNNDVRKGIFATLNTDSFKVAIDVDNKKLFLITETAVKAGMARPDTTWNILRDNGTHLIAMLSELDNPDRDMIQILMINKKNGMGSWTKTRATNLGTDMPEAESFLLKCN